MSQERQPSGPHSVCLRTRASDVRRSPARAARHRSLAVGATFLELGRSSTAPGTWSEIEARTAEAVEQAVRTVEPRNRK